MQILSYFFTVQLLIDFDDPIEWINEELGVSVSTDNGVEDGSILVTVHILCYQLYVCTHTHKHTHNSEVIDIMYILNSITKVYEIIF